MIDWKPLIGGLLLGAVVAYFVSGGGKGGFGPANITGQFARPFQAGIDSGR